MKIALNRVILFVQDVDRLTKFYRDGLGLEVVETIAAEWAVLRAGVCEVALHRVGDAWRVDDASGWQAQNNIKLVFHIDDDLAILRTRLIALDAAMGEVETWPGQPGPHCDGRDPEGNVFQLVQA